MKKSKNILFLAIGTMVATLTASGGMDVVDGVAWTYSNVDGGVRIDYIGSNKTDRASGLYKGECRIPDELGGEAVVEIGSSAFSQCRILTDVEVPDSVRSIGDEAFSGCSSLRSLPVGRGVKTIGDQAYKDCARAANPLLPAGLESIGEQAFYGCMAIDEALIPAGVTSVGRDLFYKCDKLRSIQIPPCVTSVSKICPDYEWREGVSSYDPLHEVTLYAQLTNIVLVGAFEEIGGHMFEGCSAVRELVIPEGVVSIGDSAFKSCSSLSRVEIPDRVRSIGAYAFSGCSSLASIVLPAQLESVSDRLFDGCIRLARIVIPDGVVSIGVCAFYGCKVLVEVRIPESVRTISAGAFQGCLALPEVIIPGGVTSVASGAFRECDALRSVQIPPCVTSLQATFPYYEWYEQKYNGRVHHEVTQYAQLTNVVLAGAFRDIGASMFSGCSAIVWMSVPEGVTNIGSRAFYSCYGLRGVEVPASVRSIGNEAFSGCSSLRSLPVGRGVKTIGDQAYGDCKYANADFVVPEGAVSIGECAFSGCLNIGSIRMPDSVTTIGQRPFYKCDALKSLRIPPCVTSVSALCPRYEWYERKYNGTVHHEVTQYAQLTNIEISSSLVSIADSMFLDCSKLRNMILPRGVTNIGRKAFQGCSSLSTITFTGPKAEVRDDSFQNLNNCTIRYSLTDASWAPLPESTWGGAKKLFYSGFFDTGERFATVADLAAAFGAESSVAKSIKDAGELDEFNAFLDLCGSVPPRSIPSSAMPWVYESFKVSKIVKTPALYESEPEIVLDDLAIGDGGTLRVSVSLKVGSAGVDMIRERLGDCFRVGYELNAMNDRPQIEVWPDSDGKTLTFGIKRPAWDRWFLKVDVD